MDLPSAFVADVPAEAPRLTTEASLPASAPEAPVELHATNEVPESLFSSDTDEPSGADAAQDQGGAHVHGTIHAHRPSSGDAHGSDDGNGDGNGFEGEVPQEYRAFDSILSGSEEDGSEGEVLEVDEEQKEAFSNVDEEYKAFDSLFDGSDGDDDGHSLAVGEAVRVPAKRVRQSTHHGKTERTTQRKSAAKSASISAAPLRGSHEPLSTTAAAKTYQAKHPSVPPTGQQLTAQEWQAVLDVFESESDSDSVGEL
jgi:hypothetical protein